MRSLPGALGGLLLAACGAPAPKVVPAVDLPSPPAQLVPLAVEPPFATEPVPGFAELKLYENLLDFGFTADEKRFVGCHGGRYAPPLRRECDVDTLGSGSSADTLSSDQEFDDGHSPRDDAKVNAELAKLGFPAPQGKWPYADLVITWRRTDPQLTRIGHSDAIFVFLRERSTGGELPLGDIPAEGPGDRVYPRAAVLSSSGALLAFVVAESDGKSLRLEHQIWGADGSAAGAYAKAVERAPSPAAAEAFRAKARAAYARGETARSR